MGFFDRFVMAAVANSMGLQMRNILEDIGLLVAEFDASIEASPNTSFGRAGCVSIGRSLRACS